MFNGKSLKYEVAKHKDLQELDICTMTFQFGNLKDHAKKFARMKEKLLFLTNRLVSASLRSLWTRKKKRKIVREERRRS